MDAKEELLISYLDSLSFPNVYEENYIDNVTPENDKQDTSYEPEKLSGHCRDDIIIQYCRGTSTIPCQEFSTLVMDYKNPPSPWRCPKHNKPEFSKATAKKRYAKAEKDVDFNPETTDKISYESTSFFRFSNSRPAQQLSVGPSENSSTSKNPVRVSKQQNILNCALDLELSTDTSSDSIVSEAYSDLFPNSRGDFKATRATGFFKSQSSSDLNLGNEGGQDSLSHNIEISQATLNRLYSPLVNSYRDIKRHIYIYSIRPSSLPGQESRQYYKIGCQLNIKHDNMSRLKRCPMMQDIQTKKFRASMAQLLRTPLTSFDIFMALLRSELTRNNFTLLSQDENYCIMCYGYHNEWFSISKEACAQLELTHSVPGNSLHAGWPYLNALTSKLLSLTS
ncbi:hypothetical protein DSO57_1010752 [Entomophthora muscae]|uniref:Uncharacterized protein n=1 Tax=Entomophthora muscae TaxID=34485 RepID=A0ACC2TH89_9FUNG|nr:hypothetical protein DSO57_1010752 [Entomophthora muscae]